MTFLGWLSDLFERLSDLQLGDQKVTLNHLVVDVLFHSAMPTIKRHHLSHYLQGFTLPETNIAPEKIMGLEDDPTSFWDLR